MIDRTKYNLIGRQYQGLNGLEHLVIIKTATSLFCQLDRLGNMMIALHSLVFSSSINTELLQVGSNIDL